jgi:hypothetical protein
VIERVADTPQDERAAPRHGARRAVGLLVVEIAQAVLVLRRRIAVDEREGLEIRRAAPLEIVIAHADEQRDRCEIAALGQLERKIVDERAIAGVDRERGPRGGRLRAHVAQRPVRQLLVATVGDEGTNGVRLRGGRRREDGDHRGAEPARRARGPTGRDAPHAFEPDGNTTGADGRAGRVTVSPIRRGATGCWSRFARDDLPEETAVQFAAE